MPFQHALAAYEPAPTPVYNSYYPIRGSQFDLNAYADLFRINYGDQIEYIPNARLFLLKLLTTSTITTTAGTKTTTITSTSTLSITQSCISISSIGLNYC